jgi:DNA-binding transcriptional LysR family regulator
MLPHLKDGQLDMVVSLLEDRDYGGGLAQERLYEERFVVIAGRNHALVRRSTVTWKDAVAYPWTGPPASSPVRRELEQELALANQPLPRFATEVSSTMLMATLLENTNMLSLVSSETAASLRRAGRIRVLPLAAQRRGHVGVVWRKDLVFGQLETGFLQALRQACASRAT